MADEPVTVSKVDVQYDAEDEVHDWRFLSKAGSGIPKRGDKDFEPDGTQVQRDGLQESRDAMYEALGGVRGHHMKHKLISVWVPLQNYSIVPHAKGNYFRDMGKPVNLGTRIKDGMQLNPLETVYLVERGSMVIYVGNAEFERFLAGDVETFDYEKLVKMDLAMLYAYAFVDCLVDHYQVYSYLKRHGYLVRKVVKDTIGERNVRKYQATKDKKPEASNLGLGLIDSIAVSNAGSDNIRSKPTSLPAVHLLTNIITSASTKVNCILHYIFKNLRQVGLISLPITNINHYLTKHYFNYTSVFRSLRLIPTSTTIETPHTEQSSYNLHFDVWKPTPTFSKKNPPAPDFQICIVSSEATKFPTLSTIQSLLSETIYDPTPKVVGENSAKKFSKKNSMPPSKKEIRQQRQKARQAKLDASVQLRNKYLKTRDIKLKFGHGRSVVIAVVDNGILNFVNLAEGDFALDKCQELEELFPLKSHGIIYVE